MSLIVERFHDIFDSEINLESSEINLNHSIQNHNDFFYGFSIFQISLLKFLKYYISNNISFIVFTNLESNFDFFIENLIYLNISYFTLNFNNNPYSIQIDLNKCWTIPSVPITIQLNDFYNNLLNQLLNTYDNIIDEDFKLTFNQYIDYLKNLHNIKYECIPIDKKQLLSDLIYEHKDNMTDFAFLDIMEKIANL